MNIIVRQLLREEKEKLKKMKTSLVMAQNINMIGEILKIEVLIPLQLRVILKILGHLKIRL